MSGKVCLYEKICGDLKEHIISGKLKHNEKLPSIIDIRSKYGVSHITTLRVFKELVNANYIEFFKGKGYFVCYRKNRTPMKSSGLIACLTRPFRKITPYENYFNEINCGIQNYCTKNRINMFQHYVVGLLKDSVLLTNDEQKEIRDTIFKVSELVDGFIIDQRVPDNLLSECLDKIAKPFVIVNRTSKLDIDTITCDSFAGAVQAAELSLKMGFSNFILCSPGSEPSNESECINYFIKVLESNNITNIQVVENCSYAPANVIIENAWSAIRKTSQKTMFFSPTAAIGRYFVDELTKKGVEFGGGKTGMICFGSEGYPTLFKPYITSVNIQTYEIGEKAVEILNARIKGLQMRKGNHTIPVSFTIRETT